MKYKFKIGDIVKLNPEEYNNCFDEIPDWNISKSYIIVKFSNEYDSDGEPIVTLNKSFSDNFTKTSITTQFILPDIKEQRKQKLNKINESR